MTMASRRLPRLSRVRSTDCFNTRRAPEGRVSGRVRPGAASRQPGHWLNRASPFETASPTRTGSRMSISRVTTVWKNLATSSLTVTGCHDTGRTPADIPSGKRVSVPGSIFSPRGSCGRKHLHRMPSCTFSPWKDIRWTVNPCFNATRFFPSFCHCPRSCSGRCQSNPCLAHTAIHCPVAASS